MSQSKLKSNSQKKSIVSVDNYEELVQVISFDKDNILNNTTDEGIEVYHVSPLLQEKPFLTIRTIICHCSGLYVNIDKKTGKRTISATIWMARNWKKGMHKQTSKEKQHEAMWNALYETNNILDTPEYKVIKTKIGIPKAETVISRLKSMVRDPVFQSGPEKGEIDPDRPRRIKANVWIAKPKETSTAKEKEKAKAKTTTKELKTLPEEGAVPGERMLCKFQTLDGTPIAMEELYERPFDAVFTIVWSADFFGAKSSCMLKISNISVCKLLEKTSNNDLTEGELEEIREQYAALRAEEEDEADDVDNPVELTPPPTTEAEEDNVSGEEPAPPPSKKGKEKVLVLEEEEEEEKPKPKPKAKPKPKTKEPEEEEEKPKPKAKPKPKTKEPEEEGEEAEEKPKTKPKPKAKVKVSALTEDD